MSKGCPVNLNDQQTYCFCEVTGRHHKNVLSMLELVELSKESIYHLGKDRDQL